MSSSPTQILVNLFNFIVKEGKRDLDPDHYQLAFRTQGLGVSLVIKYLPPAQDIKKELGIIGLNIL